MQKLAAAILVIILAGLVGWFVASSGGHGAFAPPSPYHNSYLRLTVLTDQDTGCQYLSDGRGLTARLDANGKPMCGAGH